MRTAEALLRAGAVHAAASDAHSAGERYAAVPAGLERLGALVGEAGRNRLLIETPSALLAGAPIPPPAVDATGDGRHPEGGWRTRLRRLARLQ
jgi:hypothetical protein